MQNITLWIARMLFVTAFIPMLGCAHHQVVTATNADHDPLVAAVLMHDYKTATKLLDQGYPVEGKSIQPNEPAFWAITENDAKALRMLISYGLNVNYDWGYGSGNLLTNAVQLGRIEIVRLLCEAGASTFRDPKLGGTPLYAAIIYDQKGIERYLRSRGARFNDWDLDALRILGLQAN